MSEYRFQIQLTCDAELRTGIGGQCVNSYVPRDGNGNPYLPGTHIKGLMRAALRELAIHRSDWESAFEKTSPHNTAKAWPYTLLDAVFGQEDSEDKLYFSNVRVEHATIPGDSQRNYEGTLTHFVSRTALDHHGMARETSLRTTEAIAAGTKFVGSVFSDVDSASVESIAWRLGLLAISAVGGSRSRNGQCVVDLLDDDEKPQSVALDQLLRKLDEAIRAGGFHRPHQQNSSQTPFGTKPSESTAVIELIFVAATPVCFPERPDRGNLITSGFCVPASAIQGAVLHLINRHDTVLADSLFAARNFRCWPLNPCSDKNAETKDLAHATELYELFDTLPRSIRVSLSHRAAKFTLGDVEAAHFFDSAFGPREDAYHWPETPDGAPLKSSDGVLLFGSDPGVRLWRSSMMARSLTTHGVIEGSPENSESGISRRNLYSVEAMRPICWRGMMVVPENVADDLIDRINQCTEFRLGKGRSVRGRGRLCAQRSETANSWLGIENSGRRNLDRTALVLQSPVAIPEELHQQMTSGGLSADDVLRKLASDWITHHGLSSLGEKPSTWASTGLRFGWNRHASDKPFQAATAVLLPGSVFTLSTIESPENMANAIVSGFFANPGDTDRFKDRGFGCLAVHPGTASEFFVPTSRLRRGDSGPLADAMRVVYEMRSVSHLPSSSQIRAVEQRILLRNPRIAKASLFVAKKYLKSQCERLPEIFYVWEPVLDHVESLLTNYEPEVAKQALKSLADISVVRHDREEQH